MTTSRNPLLVGIGLVAIGYLWLQRDTKREFYAAQGTPLSNVTRTGGVDDTGGYVTSNGQRYYY